MTSQNSENKSYLSDTLSAFSPWATRTSTPKLTGSENEADGVGATLGRKLSVQRGGDHSVSHVHRLSLKQYPKDCPKLDVKWFHAVDVAKRKPAYSHVPNDDKPIPPPKKWVTFSPKDSHAIETAFQRLSDEDEKLERAELHGENNPAQTASPGNEQRSDDKPNRSVGKEKEKPQPSVKVPVNEDYLFDVDIRPRELGPSYWLGPVYEVRRGTWFFIDGSALRPCDENLAMQLEEGYLKTRPWRLKAEQHKSSNSTDNTGKAATKPEATSEVEQNSEKEKDVPRDVETEDSQRKDQSDITHPSAQTHRLFGAHMNSMVTYQDKTTAWLVSDDFLSRMSGTMYERFAGGAHYSGTKVIRGYTELSKKKTTRESRTTSTSSTTAMDQSDPEKQKLEKDSKRKSAPPGAIAPVPLESVQDLEQSQPEKESQGETRVRTLERQMSNLVASVLPEDPNKQDEEAREREEREIRDDYRDDAGDAQDREIEHLIFVTHGVGQRLGARFETFNFIHDVNELRKTLKTVYNSAPDLQALNSEIDRLPKNCRVQVLPICWRHLLDFPMQAVRQNRKEHDITDAGAEEDNEYATLESITVEGVPALRNIVVDLALDILLYQTPAYRQHISRIVVRECNRIFKLFKERNPSFKGKISLIGHSLGSAIMFDVLSEQQDSSVAFMGGKIQAPPENSGEHLNFDVENLFCLGSPIGLFQMLKGKTIAGRRNQNKVTLDGSEDAIEDPFHGSAYSKLSTNRHADQHNTSLVSSPKCRHLFNIFHPTDPISYRMEPLISPAMATLKPQPLPYTKKSLFGAPMGQGLTGIPAKVGQSFSGFWTNFSSGIANSFINRSLGISAEDAAKLSAPAQTTNQANGPSSEKRRSSLLGSGAGTNIVSGGVITPGAPAMASITPSEEDERKRKLAQTTTDFSGLHPPTLLDSELETLFSGFQKRRKSGQSDGEEGENKISRLGGAEAEARGRTLRKEEMRVRALNSNGRVDYSIQEGAFDISFLASIASHLSYWTDEDVSHFIVSQLLSKQRSVRKSKSMGSLT